MDVCLQYGRPRAADAPGVHPAGRAARIPPMTLALWGPPTFVLAFRHALAALRMDSPGTDPLKALQDRNRQLAVLLQAAARGDGRAFEQFYLATARGTLSAVRRIVGDAWAEDVLADCYFQAWRQAPEFDAARGSALGWLLALARSRALDRLRQETLRHGGAPGATAWEPDAAEAHPDPGPDALLESVQQRSALHDAIGTLSANERWVLGLAYFRDLTQAEIATRTGLPLGTVKSLMNRSQQKLRAALQPERTVADPATPAP